MLTYNVSNQHDCILKKWREALNYLNIFPAKTQSYVLIQTPSIFEGLHKEPGMRLPFEYYLGECLAPLDGIQFLVDESFFIDLRIPRENLMLLMEEPKQQAEAFEALAYQIKEKMPVVQTEICNEWIFMIPQNQLYNYHDYEAMASMNECFHRLRHLFPLMVDVRQMPDLLDEEHVIKKVDGFDHTWKKIHEWNIILNKKDLMTFCHEESPQEILEEISAKIQEQILQQHYHAEKRNHGNI